MNGWKVYGYEPGAAWVYPATETARSGLYEPPTGCIGCVSADFWNRWEWATPTTCSADTYPTRAEAVAALIAHHEAAK